MGQTNIKELEKDQLLEQMSVLKKRLDKKKNELVKTKTKLVTAKEKLEKLKVTVRFQRDRILELYRASTSLTSQP